MEEERKKEKKINLEKNQSEDILIKKNKKNKLSESALSDLLFINFGDITSIAAGRQLVMC